MNDDKGWAVASFLIRRGFPYYRLGVPFPVTMKEAEMFVVIHAEMAVIE